MKSMKSKTELLKDLKTDRLEFTNGYNDELVLFESEVDFGELYTFIEDNIKEQYPRLGNFKVEIDLRPYLPQDFEYNYTSEIQCDYFVRDNIVKELAEKGYSIYVDDLKLTIS